MKKAFESYKQLTDRKKEVTHDDLVTILTEIQTDTTTRNTYKMESFSVQYGTTDTPTATVVLTTPDGQVVEKAGTGQGSIEALYDTLDSLVVEELEFVAYQLNSVGAGKDALAEASVQLIVNEERLNGRGSARGVIEASAHAFLHAVIRQVMNEQTRVKRNV